MVSLPFGRSVGVLWYGGRSLGFASMKFMSSCFMSPTLISFASTPAITAAAKQGAKRLMRVT